MICKKIWLERTYNRCITKARSTSHDSAICEAISNDEIQLSKATYIFGHSTTRKMDTRLAEFIHGSSTAFQNFNASLDSQNSSICLYCKRDYDSPEHQLLHCEALDDQNRRKLLEIVSNSSKSTTLSELVFCGTAHTHKLLYDRVKYLATIT